MDLINLYREYEKVSSCYSDSMSLEHKQQVLYVMCLLKKEINIQEKKVKVA